MKFIPVISATCIVLLLSACAGSVADIVGADPKQNNTELVMVLRDSPSSRTMTDLANCIKSGLEKKYPSANLRKRVGNLYDGWLPGPNANQPLAVYTLNPPDHGMMGATVILKQMPPLDAQFTKIFNDCL